MRNFINSSRSCILLQHHIDLSDGHCVDLDGIMFKYELYITLVQLKCIANPAAPGSIALPRN